jgi:predicted nucleotidyltransferase
MIQPRNSKFKIHNSKFGNSQSAIRNRKSEIENSLMQRITAEIRARLPDATAIIFFGSRVAGVADTFSDYDVLVLLPDGLEEDERRRVKREMQTAFPGVKLDMVLGSERWLRARMPYEPFYRFWLKESVVTWGKGPNIKRFPPLATGAMKSYLGIVGAEIDFAAAVEDRRVGSRIGLNALEMLLEIDHAFKHNYSTRAVRQAMGTLVGSDLVARVRNPKSKLAEKDQRALLRMARAKYRAVKAMLEAMPENSADRRWRKQCLARSHANSGSNPPRNV